MDWNTGGGALDGSSWLDDKYDSEPLYFLGLTIFAFIISSVGIGMAGVKYMKMVEKDEEDKKEFAGFRYRG